MAGDHLVPREGGYEAYDSVQAQIKALEERLERKLKSMKKELGCDSIAFLQSRDSLDPAVPFHIGIARRVSFLVSVFMREDCC